ncbi:MAG: NTP transferase domain-containing protein [Alphaproteobacteria bacterium]
MKFGPVPVEDAGGAILAHSLPLRPRIAKGTKLALTHLERIAAAGMVKIVVARMEAGDVGEDEAALRLAGAVGGAGCRAGAAFAGRVNLFAKTAGVMVVDAGAVTRLNQTSQDLTLATLKPFEVVAVGQLVATIKVISFAVPEEILDGAIAACAQVTCLAIAGFSKTRVGLVVTRGAKPALLAKTRDVTAARVARLGGDIIKQIECAHQADEVAAAIGQLGQAGCDPIIVFSSYASVDKADVIPSGLVQAGGEIVHFGMPVDPGNLLLLGRLGAATVVGAPGCARSPARNGFDWVLARVMAGQELTSTDIAGMGVGGLLKEIPSRPQPRETASQTGAAAIAAVVLAAGASRRMGAANKLTEVLGGKALVAQVVEAALASQTRPVIVVTGHQSDQVAAVLSGLDVALVHNPNQASGLASSLAVGINALGANVGAALVMLGDMPHIRAEHLNKLIAAFDPDEGRAIVVPMSGGRRGNPVLWARRFFGALAGLSGDVGAKHLIGENESWVVEVELDSATLKDIDTEQALSAARRELGGRV